MLWKIRIEYSEGKVHLVRKKQMTWVLPLTIEVICCGRLLPRSSGEYLLQPT